MIAFGSSHKGCVRPTNQDTFAMKLFDEGQEALLVVCDGMGGANAGNVASRFASESFVETFCAGRQEPLTMERAGALLQSGVDAANQTVFSLAAQQPEFRGMGTTLVAAYVTQNGSVIANVGDSRAYRIADHKAIQLTEDHSYVQDLLRRGKLTPEEARTHPHKNLITRAVGVDACVDSDLVETKLAEGETLLLCSDGLTGPVEEETIVQIVEQADSLESAAQLLIEEACKNGGPDNITAVLCRLTPSTEQEECITNG